MEIEKNDETLEEILIEDEKELLKAGRKKRGCLARLMMFMIIVMATFLGFIFIQQFLLDLEAEAIVSAARTATAMGSVKNENTIESNEPENADEIKSAATPTSSPASIDHSMVDRTATIAVQLTDVAAFQLTATAEP